jgi:transcriptional regulator with XRE-family HTH domain
VGSLGDDSDQRYSQEFWEALGRTIKVLRTDQGIGRRELAARAGISYSYLTEIENGNKPPSSNVLGPIADSLGMRMHRLIEAAEARLDGLGPGQAQAAARALAGRRSAVPDGSDVATLGGLRVDGAAGRDGGTFSETADADAPAPHADASPAAQPASPQAAFPVTLAHEWLSRFGSAARSPQGPAPSSSHREDRRVLQDRRPPHDRRDPRAPAWSDPADETKAEPIAYLRMGPSPRQPGADDRPPSASDDREPESPLHLAEREGPDLEPRLREIRRPPAPTPHQIRAALSEFQYLLRHMSPEDIERLLDFARRLAQ